MPEIDNSGPDGPEASPVLAIRGTVTAAGQLLTHVQFVSDRYVVTDFARTTTLHSDALGGRFVVDHEKRELRRVDPASRRIQVGHLREIVGDVSVHHDADQVEVNGFTCRRYRICNDSARLIVSAEAYCARVDAIGRTALHREREFEAILHPFALPLAPDELVISSDTRTYANGFQHVQSYRHASMAPAPEAEVSLVEAFLDYSVVEP